MDSHDGTVIEAALRSLAGDRLDLRQAASLVPNQPGLYAIYGDDESWTELAARPVFKGQPLYVGKAERSLNGRDVRTHFASGKTGSSTVRRSLAALLVNELNLVAVPRNLDKPDDSANFALDPPSDARLSAWMHHHLSLATWVRAQDVKLDIVETTVLQRLRPLLNLSKVGEPRDRLRQARSRLALQARAWKCGR